MKIPLYLAVAQWTLLFAFGLLLIVVFRQLGRMLHKDDASAPLGPAVGGKAASLEYSRFADDTVPSQPVSPRPARSEESWSQSRSRRPAP